MKIVQKLAFVLITLIICQYQLAASSHSHFSNNLIDTIPQIEPEYKGNRIVVKSIKVIKKKGKNYKIEYKLVNNGRNKIKLGKPGLIPKDLIIQFDKSLEENDLTDAKMAIMESIKKQSISIRPGQLIMGKKMKFTHKPIPPSDRIAEEIKIENPVENIQEEVIAKNEIPKVKITEIEAVETPSEQIEEEVIVKNEIPQIEENKIENIEIPSKIIEEEVIVEETTDAPLESPRTPTKSFQVEKEINETTLSETILVKENIPTEKLEIEETESILEVTPSEPVQIEETEIVEIEEIEKIDSTSSSEIAEKIEIETVQEETPINNEPVITDSNEKLCADLIIEKAEVSKKNKRYVWIKYTIKNVGNIPISLHGETKKEFDNIAIQSHLTRSHKLTRGSIPVDISFIKKGNKDIKGLLAPGESTNQKLKVDLLKVTRFTPVLALTLNPTSSTFECSRLNNVFFIDIAEKAPEPINASPKKPTDLEIETSEKVSTLEN